MRVIRRANKCFDSNSWLLKGSCCLVATPLRGKRWLVPVWYKTILDLVIHGRLHGTILPILGTRY